MDGNKETPKQDLPDAVTLLTDFLKANNILIKINSPKVQMLPEGALLIDAPTITVSYGSKTK